MSSYDLDPQSLETLLHDIRAEAKSLIDDVEDGKDNNDEDAVVRARKAAAELSSQLDDIQEGVDEYARDNDVSGYEKAQQIWQDTKQILEDVQQRAADWSLGEGD